MAGVRIVAVLSVAIDRNERSCAVGGDSQLMHARSEPAKREDRVVSGRIEEQNFISDLIDGYQAVAPGDEVRVRCHGKVLLALVTMRPDAIRIWAGRRRPCVELIILSQRVLSMPMFRRDHRHHVPGDWKSGL